MDNGTARTFVMIGIASWMAIGAGALGSDSEGISGLVEILCMPKSEENVRRAELDKAIVDLEAMGDEAVAAIMGHGEWNRMNRAFQHRAVGVLTRIGTSKAQQGLLDIALGRGPVKGQGSNWAARNYVKVIKNRGDAKKLLTSKRPDVLCTALKAIEGLSVDADSLGQLENLLKSKRYYLCFRVAAVMGADPETTYVQEKVSAIVRTLKAVEQFPDVNKPFPNPLAVGTIADHMYFRLSDALSLMKGADGYLRDISNTLKGKAYWCLTMARARRGDSSVKSELYRIVRDKSAGMLRCYAVRSLGPIGTSEDLPFLRELAEKDSLAVDMPHRGDTTAGQEEQPRKVYPVRSAAKEAIRYIEKLISRFGSNPATAKALDNIADGYRGAKKPGRARELYQWVVENQPEAEHAIESQVSTVKVCIAMGDDPNTETEVGRLLSLFGDRDGIASAVESVGDEYFKQERYVKALELYSKVVDTWPADEDAIEAQIGIVESHIGVGDDNAAEAGIDRLLVDFANDSKLGEAAERIADYYSDMGRPNKSYAVSEYFGQWTSGAAAMGAQVGLAMSYIAAGDEPNTASAIDKLIADYNELASFAESAFDVATQCFYKRNYGQAIRLWKLVFKRGHLLERHNAEIPHLLGTCYERLGDYDKAIGYYTGGVTNYPESKHVYRAPYRLGMLYRRTGDYQKSIYWFGQQWVLYDNEDFSAKALFFRSVIYRITEEYDKALADLQEYSRKYPDGISAAVVPLGMAYCDHKLGNTSQAIEILQQGLRKYGDTIYGVDYQSRLDALQSGRK